jgi:cardiolipin synthase
VKRVTGLTVFLLLFVFQLAAILIAEYRRPARFVAWTAILFILPVVGFFLYYFVARDYRNRRVVREWRRTRAVAPTHGGGSAGSPQKQAAEDGGADAYERLYRLAERAPRAKPVSGNAVTVYNETEEMYEALLAAMAQAEDHIHAEYYTIRDDRIGRRFQELFIRKAREGTAVRILYDGVGSYRLGEKYRAPLREAGVEIKCFLPPLVALLDRRINYRNHRKVVVIDGRVGFLGGANIGDEYLGANPKLGYWRDTQVKLEGPAVRDLQRVFLDDWELVTGRRPDSPLLFPDPVPLANGERVQVLAGGPDRPYDPIHEVFFTAITLARRRIWIETPYFVPDPALYKALCIAGAAGVDVRVILPAVSDTKFVYYASLSYLEGLLDAGVRVYRYHKGFLHAKVLIVDEAVASAGSANMDMRSFFSNFECNALFYDRGAIGRLAEQFEADLREATEIRPERFRSRPRAQKVLEGAARLFAPLL